jgi:hypothetical protein
MTKQEFNEDRQAKFRQALATAAGVKIADVTIDKVTETSARRGASIRVDSSVAASGGKSAESVQALMTADRINAELSNLGLPKAKMLDPASQAGSSDGQTTATPPPSPQEAELGSTMWKLHSADLDAYLDYFLPSTSFAGVLIRPPCSVDSSEGCYTDPAPINHLSRQPWIGTLRVLFICTIVQVGLAGAAALWDFLRVGFRRVLGTQSLQLPLNLERYQLAMVSVLFCATLSSCGTFVLRCYHNEHTPPGHMDARTLLTVNIIDLVGAGLYFLWYLLRYFQWHQLKASYTRSLRPHTLGA